MSYNRRNTVDKQVKNKTGNLYTDRYLCFMYLYLPKSIQVLGLQKEPHIKITKINGVPGQICLNSHFDIKVITIINHKIEIIEFISAFMTVLNVN